MEHETNEAIIMVVPPIQSPPRSGSNGTVALNQRKHLHQCQQCDYSAKTQSILKKHMNNHGRKLKFKCQNCDFSSNHKSCVTLHQKNQHLSLQLFPDNYHDPKHDSAEEEEANELLLELEENSESDSSSSATDGSGTMPEASKLANRLPMRKQDQSNPFFLSNQRERKKRRLHPLGLHSSPQKRVKHSLTMIHLKSLSSKKLNSSPLPSLTRIVEGPVTPLDRSSSPLAEENPPSQESRKINDYKCPKCDFTVSHLDSNASRIKQHEINHEGNGRHKCHRCSFSHNHLNILKVHSRFDHREKQVEEMVVDESTVKNSSQCGTPDCDEENCIDSPTSKGEEIIDLEALESPGSPPDLGGPMSSSYLEEGTECVNPGSPPVLEALAETDPGAQDSQKVRCDPVESSAKSNDDLNLQTSESNPEVGDESREDDHFASETLETNEFSEEDVVIVEQLRNRGYISPPNVPLQDSSFLHDSEELRDDSDDLVLLSDVESPEVIQEDCKKTELPDWKSSESRIQDAHESIKQYDILLESVRSKKSEEGVIPIELQAKLRSAESECQRLLDSFNAELDLEQTAVVRLHHDIKHQQLIVHRNHPQLCEARRNLDDAKKSFQTAILLQTQLEEEENSLKMKIEEVRCTKSGLQNTLFRELEIFQQSMEDIIFKTEEMSEEISKQRQKIESGKANLKELEKKLQSFLDQEKSLRENRRRADDSVFQMFEQQKVRHTEFITLERERKTAVLFYQDKVDRLTSFTEKNRLSQKLFDCLLKIQSVM